MGMTLSKRRCTQTPRTKLGAALNFAKERKSSRREERELLQDFYEQDEDFLYGPGLAD